jgi:hypothetical protein
VRKADYALAITEHLGVPALLGSEGPWSSRSGTIVASWFASVANVFGIQYTDKVETMRAILTAAGVRWDPARHASAETSSGGGGNIRSEAFIDLLDALGGGGLPLDVAEQPLVLTPTREVRAGLGAPGRASGEDLGECASSVELHLQSRLYAPDSEVMRAILSRHGQTDFRERLLRAYGAQCAITGVDTSAALEAAHIAPHSAGGTYETSNGLLLRSDLHTLFDLGLFGVDGDTWTVVVHDDLRGSTYDDLLRDTRLRIPAEVSDHPDRAALAIHNRAAGLVA